MESMFKLHYNYQPDPWIAIRDTKEITKEQELKLVDIMTTSIEDSWDFDESNTYLDSCICEDHTIEQDGEELILSMCLSLDFYTEVYGYYDSGRNYGSAEDCYPEDIQFEDEEIIFKEKKCKDLIMDKISKEDILKDLNIDRDDIEPECVTLDECDDYEILDY